MAWIKSDIGLPAHPKTRRLARALGVGIPAAIGHLHMLWYWTATYAPNGDLARFEAQDIADAAGWEGDAKDFVAALVLSRFVDLDGDLYVVHDWMEHGGALFERRERNAKRMRDSRAQHVPRTKPARAAHMDACVELEERRGEEIRGDQEEIPSTPVGVEGGPGETSSPKPAAVAAPRRRNLTEDAIAKLQDEHPHIDVKAAAEDYLNWSGSSEHKDKVLGLRNQLKSPKVAAKFARNGHAITQGPARKEQWAGAERGAPNPYSLDELRKRPNFLEVGDDDDGAEAETGAGDPRVGTAGH